MIVYNDNDRFAVQWLRNLVAAGEVAPGVVDGRSLEELRPDDVRSAVQFHAFAGIGGWSRALRLAGWPDDLPVWTGSCPCQPFSNAGPRTGFSDDRHLWPTWFGLIRECRPAVVFGEQVASPAGRAWLDVVLASLEGEGYACCAADLPAAGVGAPHGRQRLWFSAVRLADCDGAGLGEQRERAAADVDASQRVDAVGRSAQQLGDADCDAAREHAGKLPRDEAQHDHAPALLGDGPGDAGDAHGGGGFWNGPDLVWIPCRDGRTRPAQSGIQPLAHGVLGRVAVARPGHAAGAAPEAPRWANRVGALRGVGNAIVPQVAAAFIRAVRDAAAGAGLVGAHR